MNINQFQKAFGDIIYAGTLTETTQKFCFKLCDRSMELNKAMVYQPIVEVNKEDLKRVSNSSELFHDFLTAVSE